MSIFMGNSVFCHRHCIQELLRENLYEFTSFEPTQKLGVLILH